MNESKRFDQDPFQKWTSGKDSDPGPLSPGSSQWSDVEPWRPRRFNLVVSGGAAGVGAALLLASYVREPSESASSMWLAGAGILTNALLGLGYSLARMRGSERQQP